MAEIIIEGWCGRKNVDAVYECSMIRIGSDKKDKSPELGIVDCTFSNIEIFQEMPKVIGKDYYLLIHEIKDIQNAKFIIDDP